MVDKSSRLDIPMAEQVAAWEKWNTDVARGTARTAAVNIRQARRLDERMASLGRHDLDIVDVGCGNGWICERLTPYGRVTGTDLVDEALQAARSRLPNVTFISGDLFTVPLPEASFDVVVSLEVMSHVADQQAFLKRLAALLRPGGRAFLATQNRSVLERWSVVPGPQPGQIRRWVDAKQLRALMASDFYDVQVESIHPVGDQGLLRITNSHKLNRLACMFVSPARIERAKEAAMLGHTLLAWARRR